MDVSAFVSPPPQQTTLTQIYNLADDSSSNESDITVTGLYIHPVKSMRAISLQEVELDSLGLAQDRRFMIVRKMTSIYGVSSWRFLTQRQCPGFATIDANFNDDGNELILSCKKRKIAINVSTSRIQNASLIDVGIWEDEVVVADLSSNEICEFLLDVIKHHEGQEEEEFSSLGIASASDLKFVLILPRSEHMRPVDNTYLPLAALQGGTSPNVSLTDGYPILISNEASLEELNRRLIKKGKEPISMSRFRPNIVIKGAKPFEEDTWKTININGIIFHVVKGCPRCKQSCTDQVTGERFEEPLETLSEFRSFGKGNDVYFAQNVVHQKGALGSSLLLKVGDKVNIVTIGNPVWNNEAAQAE